VIFIASTRWHQGRVEGRYRLALKSNPEIGAITGLHVADSVAEIEAWLDAMADTRPIEWIERAPAAPPAEG
jgi:hypothetical protein